MFFRTVRRGARAMLQAPFPVNAARAGDLRAVTAWRQRCATTEANPVDARFPFDEWRPLQLACAEGDAAAVETILAAGAAVDKTGRRQHLGSDARFSIGVASVDMRILLASGSDLLEKSLAVRSKARRAEIANAFAAFLTEDDPLSPKKASDLANPG